MAPTRRSVSVILEPKWLQNGLKLPLGFLNGWIVVLLLEYLQPMVNIFIASALLALVMDFPVRLLQRWGLLRGRSLAIVLLLGLGTITILGFSLLPMLVAQITELIARLPTWFDSAAGLLDWIAATPLAQNLSIDWQAAQSRIIDSSVKVMQGLGESLLNLFLGSFSGGLTLFFVVILTIFLLIGGEEAWRGMLNWFSPWWRERLSRQLPVKLRRFIIGQVSIAAGFSIMLALIFTVIGVPLGLLFGFLIGMASMLPFMGAIAQVSVSLFLMLQDLGIGLKVFAIAFVLGQIIDNAVMPRVMGGLVGVNPVWLIVAVFLGAKLAGVMGILVAVPIASVIKAVADDLRTESVASDDFQVIETLSEET